MIRKHLNLNNTILQFLGKIRRLKNVWLDKADSSQVVLYMTDRKLQTLLGEKLFVHIP